MFDKETQKKLKEEFRVLLADVWGKDEKMIDFCVKKADLLIKTEQGFFVEVERPSIETRFCFGYRLSSHDTEEYDDANRMANFASTNEEYLRQKNLERIQKQIDFYSNPKKELFFRNHYHRQENDKLKYITTLDYWDMPADVVNKEYKEFFPVSENERKLIVDAYKKELEMFKKRIDTYLKRYGMSKVHTWSYWQDA